MRQRGFGLLFNVIIIAVVVTFVGGVVYTYNSTLRKNVELEAAIAVKEQAFTEQAAENFQLRQRAQDLQVLLTKRRAQQNALDEVERRLNAKLNEIRSTDPKAKEWADTSVPQSVVDGLRDDAGNSGAQDGKGKPARKPAVSR